MQTNPGLLNFNNLNNLNDLNNLNYLGAWPQIRSKEKEYTTEFPRKNHRGVSAARATNKSFGPSDKPVVAGGAGDIQGESPGIKNHGIQRCQDTLVFCSRDIDRQKNRYEGVGRKGARPEGRRFFNTSPQIISRNALIVQYEVKFSPGTIQGDRGGPGGYPGGRGAGGPECLGALFPLQK